MAACETAPVVVEDMPVAESTTPSRDLLVLPLAGMDTAVGDAVGEKMAWALREAGYPARSASLFSESNPMLTGWIEEASNSGDIIWLNINWSLYEDGGVLAGTYRQETAVPRDGWMQLSSDTLAALVTQAVPAIHEIAAVGIYPDGVPPITSMQVAPAVIELTPPKPETIVVSGDGLSHMDASGKETLDQQLSIAAEPAFAPDYTPEGAPPLVFPQGSVSGDALPTVEGRNQLADASNMAVAEAARQTVQQPGQVLPEPMIADDIEVLTPETAALVTTSPELTIPEPILPSADAITEGSPAGQPLEPVEIGVAPGAGQSAVIQQPPIPAPAPTTSQQPMQQAPTINPQPALGNGNSAEGFARPVFLVRNIYGAPGDGNLSLRKGILQALRQADAMVTDNPAQASYIIQGSVQVSAPFAGRQHTRIIWLVTTITGEEVGTAMQENDVPQGSLDGSWGKVAQVIADAAIPGVAQLFDTRLDAGSAQGSLAQPDLPHVFGDPRP